MAYRKRDETPREIDAKWGSKCKCGAEIKPGDRILYYPSTRRVECMDCSQETRDALADERGGL
jgi:hypothetical protein